VVSVTWEEILQGTPPRKGNMTFLAGKPPFLIGDTKTQMVGFSVVILVFGGWSHFMANFSGLVGVWLKQKLSVEATCLFFASRK